MGIQLGRLRVRKEGKGHLEPTSTAETTKTTSPASKIDLETENEYQESVNSDEQFTLTSKKYSKTKTVTTL